MPVPITRAQLTCARRSSLAEGDLPTFGCSHPENPTGTCTVQVVDGGPWSCIGCERAEGLPPRPAHVAHKKSIIRHVSHVRASMRNENGWGWVSLERLMRDVREHLLPKVARLNLGAVAGVPRSGMAAASALATLLHVPLWTADKGGVRDLGGGRVRYLQTDRSGPTLVLEDSVYGGTSLASVKAKVGTDNVLYGAMYCRPAARFKPDVVAVELESPHFFEWHFFNSGHMDGRMSHPGLQGGAVLDMDGIICEDPTAPDEPEAGYLEWLRSAKPRWLPRTIPCRAVLTARLERHRAETEAWLDQHGVRRSALVMARPEDRRDVAAWKSARLAELQPSVYVESSERLAGRVHDLWGGTVVCPPAERMWLSAEHQPHRLGTSA